MPPFHWNTTATPAPVVGGNPSDLFRYVARVRSVARPRHERQVVQEILCGSPAVCLVGSFRVERNDRRREPVVDLRDAFVYPGEALCGVRDSELMN